MTTTTTTADLLDRDEIETLVHRLGACLDEGRFDDLRTLFTTDAVASTPGGVAQGIGLIAQASRNHAPDDGIQHLISGVLVDHDGDTASVRANLLVTFARRAPAPTGPESAPRPRRRLAGLPLRRPPHPGRLAAHPGGDDAGVGITRRSSPSALPARDGKPVEGWPVHVLGPQAMPTLVAFHATPTTSASPPVAPSPRPSTTATGS